MKKNLFQIIAVAILLLIVTMGCNKDGKITDISVAGVSLNENNISLIVGEKASLTATIYPDDATNKVVRWTSSSEVVAEVTNGIITAKEVGSATITVITEEGNHTATCVVTVTPKWVEINGVKWATRNVDMPGTFTENPEDAGMFYQWNRKIGWSSADPMVNSDGGTTWDNSSAEGDTWEKANDPCPAGWRVPTDEELQSLIDADSQWSTIKDVTGRIFGTSNETLFLPAAGYRSDYFGAVESVGTHGYYWSSSWSSSIYSFFAYALHINSANAHQGINDLRGRSYTVRCVKE